MTDEKYNSLVGFTGQSIAETLVVKEMASGFFEFKQNFTLVGDQDANYYQKIIFDTNGGWFSQSFDGERN